MKLKSPAKLFFLVFIVLGIIFSGLIFLNLKSRLVLKNFNAEKTLLILEAPRLDLVPAVLVEAEIPLYLKIPKIGVATFLEQDGLTANGEVAVPVEPFNAVWFNLWPRPGDIGNAIIVGHYGIYHNGTAAIFNNLYLLSPGDKIYTEDADGALTTFVVQRMQLYDADDAALDVFHSDDKRAHLNLITCWGVSIPDNTEPVN